MSLYNTLLHETHKYTVQGPVPFGSKTSIPDVSIHIYTHTVAHQWTLFHNISASHTYICSCHYLFLTLHVYKLDVLIVYSFVLMSPWGWKFIPATYRRVYVNGWFYIHCVHFLVCVGEKGICEINIKRHLNNNSFTSLSKSLYLKWSIIL
jgi:hypothetical protein